MYVFIFFFSHLFSIGIILSNLNIYFVNNESLKCFNIKNIAENVDVGFTISPSEDQRRFQRWK